MTPTQKKYMAEVGKLHILRERIYDAAKEKFYWQYHLCFVDGIKRGYSGKSGHYRFNVSVLSKLGHNNAWRKQYSVNCTEFYNGRWYADTYLEATKENLELVEKIVDVDREE